MYKFADLRGKRFGKLIAIEPTEQRIGGRIVWKCRCDCGKEIEVASKSLLNGHRTKCNECRAENLCGNKYGNLTVIERSRNEQYAKKYSNPVYKCICDCGNIVYVSAGHLKNGHTQSCGCLQKIATSNAAKTHGLSKDKIYRIWISMISRCEDINSTGYCNYGARGISVCAKWRNDFTEFYLWALSNGYKEGLTIERINVDGNYEPTNCTWATCKEQQNNKRNNHFITFNGKTQTMMQWSEELGINYATLNYRINIAKWTIDRALTEPVNSWR